MAQYLGKVAFDDWKQLNFPLEDDAHAYTVLNVKIIFPSFETF